MRVRLDSILLGWLTNEKRVPAGISETAMRPIRVVMAAPGFNLAPRIEQIGEPAHLLRCPGLSDALVREFIRPACARGACVDGAPAGTLRISLEIADPTVASQSTEAEAGLAVSVITAGSED